MLLSKRSLLAFAATGSLLLLAGCTARPLYADGPDAGASALLRSIDVVQAGSRVGQQVRNQLTFRLHGGGAAPSQPDYMLALSVRASNQALASVERQDDDDGRPSAARTILNGDFTLTNIKTGAVTLTGSRTASASYDVSGQQFGAERTVLNAEDRAARELAELIYLALAAQLAR